MPKALILILCLGFGLGVAVWDIYAPPPQSTAPILKPAPDVAFTLLDGTLELNDLRGKTVLINVWATWCPPCVVEIPQLLELSKRDDIELILLSIDKDTETIKRFFKDMDIDGVYIAHDPDKAVSRDILGTTMYPETHVITPDGLVKRKIEGVIDWLSFKP